MFWPPKFNPPSPSLVIWIAFVAIVISEHIFGNFLDVVNLYKILILIKYLIVFLLNTLVHPLSMVLIQSMELQQVVLG